MSTVKSPGLESQSQFFTAIRMKLNKLLIVRTSIKASVRDLNVNKVLESRMPRTTTLAQSFPDSRGCVKEEEHEENEKPDGQQRKWHKNKNIQ
ncbi:hypothetical protein EUGRSUZ_K02022 [Eucalyptus grandis]|uniref:Uncharacterized protein n=2 Tax=Eucalyptus grandis TaxID=71139 RepID=A0ACC3IVM0_EUCGR|nr:hypothetical protein EUGRSUZ_K02022 [Eucalyptus grandis]